VNVFIECALAFIVYWQTNSMCMMSVMASWIEVLRRVRGMSVNFTVAAVVVILIVVVVVVFV